MSRFVRVSLIVLASLVSGRAAAGVSKNKIDYLDKRGQQITVVTLTDADARSQYNQLVKLEVPVEIIRQRFNGVTYTTSRIQTPTELCIRWTDSLSRVVNFNCTFHLDSEFARMHRDEIVKRPINPPSEYGEGGGGGGDGGGGYEGGGYDGGGGDGGGYDGGGYDGGGGDGGP